MKAEAPHWETCWWPQRIGVCSKPAVTEVVFWQGGTKVALHVCHAHQAQAERVEARHQGAA